MQNLQSFISEEKRNLRIWTSETFPYSIIDDIDILKPHGLKKNQTRYLNIITAFDIETTNLKEISQNIMYIWMVQFGPDHTIIGRTWEEFFSFLKQCRYRLKENTRLVMYVHNLSYEFMYLKGLYYFMPDEVFCTDSRKILKCSMWNQIEFRCSYYLTNTSLNQFTHQYHVENMKLSGAVFDYSKVRYPWTDLSDYELQYCINDVKGLVQALYKKLAVTGDNIMTVPLTATGYVRRKCRQAMKGYNHLQLQEMLPDEAVYGLLREAYRGGNTHANRYYVGDIVENVKSADIVSSYPAVMLQCLYPMSKFYYVPGCTIEELKDIIFKKKQAAIFRIAFWDLRLKSMMTGCPYLSRDKCRNIENAVFDNGRILKADYLETTVTDIDFKIILNQYQWSSCDIRNVMTAYYGPLPDMLLDVIRSLYQVKTELKGVSEEDDNYFIYILNKEQLNSIYGMTAQDPVKDSIDFISDAPSEEMFRWQDRPLKELLEESNEKAFMSYAWGVWVTCHARARLQEMIDKAEATGSFIYCDTDSVKYLGDLDFSDFNKKRREECIEKRAYAFDRHGEAHFIGQFEDEGTYQKFATLGAKKYVYVDQAGKLHITIAGVEKKKGAEELGKIENFKEGFVFRTAGGTESTYNDNIDINYQVDGHGVHITDNIVISDSSYTLGITQEFKDLLCGLIQVRYADHDIPGFYKLKR